MVLYRYTPIGQGVNASTEHRQLVFLQPIIGDALLFSNVDQGAGASEAAAKAASFDAEW